MRTKGRSGSMGERETPQINCAAGNFGLVALVQMNSLVERTTGASQFRSSRTISRHSKVGSSAGEFKRTQRQEVVFLCNDQ
jgi:hypothetical protein